MPSLVRHRLPGPIGPRKPLVADLGNPLAATHQAHPLVFRPSVLEGLGDVFGHIHRHRLRGADNRQQMAGIELVVPLALGFAPCFELPHAAQPPELLPDGPQIRRGQAVDSGVIRPLGDLLCLLVFEQLVQGGHVAARADVLFRDHHDMSVPGPALLPLEDPKPILVDFGENIGRKRLEPPREILAVGDILPNGQGLQPDVFNPVFLDHPFNPAANGEHLFAQPAGQLLHQLGNGNPGFFSRFYLGGRNLNATVT